MTLTLGLIRILSLFRQGRPAGCGLRGVIKKGQSLLRGPACYALLGGGKLVACSYEALPFDAKALKFAIRFCSLIADTLVQEVSDRDYR
jgi:hypothetical protein